MLIALASILYGSVMAFTQTNARLVAGYSSVAQLGFITLGIFTLRPDGADGAVLQMVNHGLVVAPLLLLFVILVERAGSDDITRMGGLAMRAPVLAAMFLIITMALLAIPGSSNFIGEIYILFGTFESKSVLALVAFAGVAMAAYYALRLFQHAMHGRKRDDVESREIPWREGADRRRPDRLHRRPGAAPQLHPAPCRRLGRAPSSRRSTRRVRRGGGAKDELQRSRDRLRRALAGHRPDRRALRRPDGRAAAADQPLLRSPA